MDSFFQYWMDYVDKQNFFLSRYYEFTPLPIFIRTHFLEFSTHVFLFLIRLSLFCKVVTPVKKPSSSVVRIRIHEKNYMFNARKARITPKETALYFIVLFISLLITTHHSRLYFTLELWIWNLCLIHGDIEDYFSAATNDYRLKQKAQ